MNDFERIPWPVHVFDPDHFEPCESKQGWKHKDEEVYFLASRKGNALECHVGAIGRAGKRQLRRVTKIWMDEVPKQFSWCEMIIAPVKRMSVYNYCMKLGFEVAGKQQYGADNCYLLVKRF